jgi:hypothetical protein
MSCCHIDELNWSAKEETATIAQPFVSATHNTSNQHAAKGLPISRIAPIKEMPSRMHSLELLHEALRVAKRLGYSIRQEWLTTGGGVCEIHGRKWIFVDLAQPVTDQLALVREVLSRDPRTVDVAMSNALRRYLGCRRAG